MKKRAFAKAIGAALLLPLGLILAGCEEACDGGCLAMFARTPAPPGGTIPPVGVPSMGDCCVGVLRLALDGALLPLRRIGGESCLMGGCAARGNAPPAAPDDQDTAEVYCDC